MDTAAPTVLLAKYGASVPSCELSEAILYETVAEDSCTAMVVGAEFTYDDLGVLTYAPTAISIAMLAPVGAGAVPDEPAGRYCMPNMVALPLNAVAIADMLPVLLETPVAAAFAVLWAAATAVAFAAIAVVLAAILVVFVPMAVVLAVTAACSAESAESSAVFTAAILAFIALSSAAPNFAPSLSSGRVGSSALIV